MIPKHTPMAETYLIWDSRYPPCIAKVDCDAILFSAADFVKQVLSNQNVSLSLCVLSNPSGPDDKKNLPLDSNLTRHQTVRTKNKNFAYISQ